MESNSTPSPASISVVTSDGVEHTISKEHVRKLNTIALALDDIQNLSEAFPLLDVDNESLLIILKFLEEYKDVPHEVVDDARIRQISNPTEQDCSFFDPIEIEPLKKVFAASVYLDYKFMIDRIARYIAAKKIRGKSPEEICKVLNLPDDFSKEEKEELRRNYAWALSEPVVS